MRRPIKQTEAGVPLPSDGYKDRGSVRFQTHSLVLDWNDPSHESNNVTMFDNMSLFQYELVDKFIYFITIVSKLRHAIQNRR